MEAYIQLWFIIIYAILLSVIIIKYFISCLVTLYFKIYIFFTLFIYCFSFIGLGLFPLSVIVNKNKNSFVPYFFIFHICKIVYNTNQFNSFDFNAKSTFNYHEKKNKKYFHFLILFIEL